jgi:pimeloyl-ACP methyl ester carboxylesterase
MSRVPFKIFLTRKPRLASGGFRKGFEQPHIGLCQGAPCGASSAKDNARMTKDLRKASRMQSRFSGLTKTKNKRKTLKMKLLQVVMLLLVSCAVCFAQDQRWNKRYYMMNTGDTRELPAGAYVSSDEKVAVVKGNRIRAIANGDCLVHVAGAGGKQAEFAHVTVGWQVQNPVLPYSWRMYIPDNEAHVFNGRLYVHGSLDATRVYCSPYIVPAMTDDLKRWSSNGVAFSSFVEGNAFKGKNLWGSDVHYYNGKYLLYGAYEWNGEGRETNFYVVESDSPAGPFRNFRWVKGSKTKKNIDGITPKIFVEKDGTRYIVWAPTLQPVKDNYLMVSKLLADDVVDEESAVNIGKLKDFYEGPSIRKCGDIYYLVYNENCGPITRQNRTPKRISYATSKSITGPYVYRGIILTIENMEGNTNIQGSIERFNGEWYVFYHRVMNGMGLKRSLCVEKIEFDKDGLILPVVPTSSGASEGLNTALPVWFNTAVYGANYRFTDAGKYGGVVVNGAAEIGFRYIAFTGGEKQITLQGAGLENILHAKVIANGRTLGHAAGNNPIELKETPKGKTELSLLITTAGDVRLETLKFNFSHLATAAKFSGKKGNWNGFESYEFKVGHRPCRVVVPKHAAEGTPWVWRAVFWGHESQTEVALLNKGYHVAFVSCSDLLGSPQHLKERDEFYNFLTEKHGFSKKPVLLGMSRGGLCSLRWAIANPAKVSCLYLDAPVCDFKSWPGGKGKGKRSAVDWRQILKLYNLTEEEALKFNGNPVDALKPLAEQKVKVPILSVCGDSDTVVPYEENTKILAERYKNMGAPIEVILKPGIGHHPHSLKDPAPIVEFILKNTTK